MSSEKINWGLFLLVGLSFIVLGIVGISLPQMTAIAIDLLIGWLLVFGGILQGVHAVKSRQWKGFFLSTLGTILYLGAGAFLLIFSVIALLYHKKGLPRQLGARSRS